MGEQVFPAWAGNIPLKTLARFRDQGVSRLGGDDPEQTAHRCLLILCSPPGRG